MNIIQETLTHAVLFASVGVCMVATTIAISVTAQSVLRVLDELTSK